MSLGGNVGISFDMIWKIMLQLFLPFVAGQCLQPFIGGWVRSRKALLTPFDRGSILMVVYLAFSEAVTAGIWQGLAFKDSVLLVLADCLLLAVALAFTSLGGRFLGFGREHRIALPAEALLFMASRAQLVEEIIRPALARGEVVVSDRFTLANVVYQGHAGGLDPKELWAVGRLAAGGLTPDLTLVFDADLDVALSRRTRAADRLEERGREYQEAVRRGFVYEAGMRPGPYHIVDATPDLATVQDAVRARVTRLLTEYGWTLAE